MKQRSPGLWGGRFRELATWTEEIDISSPDYDSISLDCLRLFRGRILGSCPYPLLPRGSSTGK